MKAKVLRHKTMKGYHGMIRHNTLYRTGSKILPQLLPNCCDKKWLQKSIKFIDKPFVESLDNFDLIDVSVNYKS